MVTGPPKKCQLNERRKVSYSFLAHIKLLSFTINSLMTENINLLNKNHTVYPKVQNKCFWFTNYKLTMLTETEIPYTLQYARKF